MLYPVYHLEKDCQAITVWDQYSPEPVYHLSVPLDDDDFIGLWFAMLNSYLEQYDKGWEDGYYSAMDEFGDITDGEYDE